MRALRTITSGIGLIALAVSVAGCGGTNVSDAATQRYVQAEADRLCAIQRNTYATQQEQAAAFDSALDKAGLTAKERKALIDKKAKSQKLRNQIADRYATVCR